MVARLSLFASASAAPDSCAVVKPALVAKNRLSAKASCWLERLQDSKAAPALGEKDSATANSLAHWFSMGVVLPCLVVDNYFPDD
jgi:hypothetical protein